MEYYLGLELLWILTNIVSGPDEVVNELLYDLPAADVEARMTQSSKVIEFIKVEVKKDEHKHNI